jgi:ribosomal-protein-alanine N-acetyltransferase
MTPDGLARTHAAAFGGKGWPVADFTNYRSDKTILICGDDYCFVVFRLAGPEAEILTLAAHPDAQGKRRATAMMRDALTAVQSVNVEEVFLEVAEDNTPARALYDRCGFVQFATRDNYYANGAAAICMKIELSAASLTDKTT